MLSRMEIVETNKMIKESNLDVRTITMGISLMDCADSDLTKFNQKIYDKITKKAENLVKTGEDIARQYGIPVVNKSLLHLYPLQQPAVRQIHMYLLPKHWTERQKR